MFYSCFFRRLVYKKILLLLALFLGFTSSVFAGSWDLPGVTIITRTQWGADESLRYSDTSKTERDALRQKKRDVELNQLMKDNTEQFFDIQKQEYQGQVATDFLIQTTPDEQIVDDYLESSNGYYLKWPESFHVHKSKIIIHHTADDNTSLLT